METEILKIIAPVASAPISVALLLWWLKSHITRNERIPEILVEMSHLKETILELKIEVKRMNEISREVNENSYRIKAQWKRLDDTERRLREGGL